MRQADTVCGAGPAFGLQITSIFKKAQFSGIGVVTSNRGPEGFRSRTHLWLPTLKYTTTFNTTGTSCSLWAVSVFSVYFCCFGIGVVWHPTCSLCTLFLHNTPHRCFVKCFLYFMSKGILRINKWSWHLPCCCLGVWRFCLVWSQWDVSLNVSRHSCDAPNLTPLRPRRLTNTDFHNIARAYRS